jgi:superfamily II DNA helicase RecQ
MKNYKSAMHNDKFKSLILVIITQYMKIGKISEWTSPLENKLFGVIKLKPMQMAIINCNRDNDVLVNLPTGFGKSLLFQYPASQLKGKCCIVFVPLKALLWDCLKEAELHNLTASELESSFIRMYQKDEVLPQLLFLTPERFFQNQGVFSFIDMLYYKRLIQLLVIDEAHCIS